MDLIIFFAAFVCVAALVLGVGAMFVNREAVAEGRLDILAHNSRLEESDPEQGHGLLAQPLDQEYPNGLEQTLSQWRFLPKLLEQAGMPLTLSQWGMLTFGLAAAAAVLGFWTPFPLIVSPIAAVVLGALPTAYVMFSKSRRMAAFDKQLPEAMELLSRALRAGHSLGDGIRLISDEMAAPLAPEFGRCYEEQNLGVPLENALEEMTERVPNLDLRFFATAMILQRQTGGDAAEVLDKIGRLIRERFKIKGQIKALTGEGRLSGVVLLGLPIVLAIYMYIKNPEYLMKLFEDPLGVKMVIGAIVLQILGALVIRKIIDIKV